LNAWATRPDAAYESIRDAILSTRVARGAKIDEQGLEKELGLSRTPIRQALTRLAAEGLLVYIPHAGFFVRKLDVSEAIDLLEFRRILESGAAALAATRATPEQAAGLVSMAEDLDRTDRRKNMTRARELELRFHRGVAQAAGNREMLRVLRNLQFIYLTLAPESIRPEAADRRIEESATHTDVARAIAAGDSAKAHAAMWASFDATMRLLTR